VTLTGTHGNGRAFTFATTGSFRADLERVILEEHGECDSTTCDISAALRAGFPFAAAHLWIGATETPMTEAVIRFYGGLPKGRTCAPREFGDWCKWFAKNTVQCPHCEAFNFTDNGQPGTCGNCAKELPSK
jgi:hypothetical protein